MHDQGKMTCFFNFPEATEHNFEISIVHRIRLFNLAIEKRYGMNTLLA